MAPRYLQRRFEDLEDQRETSVRVGMGVSQQADSSVRPPQATCADALGVIPTTPEVWASRRHPLSMGEIRVRL